MFKLASYKHSAVSKYKTSSLSKDELNQIYEKILHQIGKDKLFTNHTLSLGVLSKATSIPSHHVTQALMSVGNTNFYSLINKYRIEYAMGLLQEQGNQKCTILEIALESGFNSKSVFNRLFKNATSMTPREYRRKYKFKD